MPISTVEILKYVQQSCVFKSGFELYSRWVPPFDCFFPLIRSLVG